MRLRREHKMTNQAISDTAYELMVYKAITDNTTQGQALDEIILEWSQYKTVQNNKATQEGINSTESIETLDTLGAKIDSLRKEVILRLYQDTDM